MEVVLVGGSGSGKTTVGRLLAERHGAELVDLDEQISRRAGAPVEAVFEREGEPGFRARESQLIEELTSGGAGSTAGSAGIDRVLATGGGAVVEPRNRWRLYRGRRVVWLDAPAATLATRLGAGPARPLLAGHDPVRRLQELVAARRRFYAAGERVDAAAPLDDVVARVESLVAAGSGGEGDRLLRAETAVGRIELGAGTAVRALAAAVCETGAARAVVVCEPRTWRIHGEALVARAAAAARGAVRLEHLLLPSGERAKTVRAFERLVRDLARLRLERGQPILALGGGAVGDAAGFAAAVYRRGVPLVQVPTTLLAQIDSAIGGKTALDLPEGKNLVGAFHQPRAILLDVELLLTLPPRQRRAALGEAVKYALLGDDRLFELLERWGRVVVRDPRSAYESGALAELVERCAWRKVEVVVEDEREEAGRIALNLGHTIGHAIEAAAAYRGVLHGEAVAAGLRGALEIGARLGVTPQERLTRTVRLLAELRLVAPRAVSPARVRDHLADDKKHLDGRLRWVLPTADGVTVHSDVPEPLVASGIAAALAGSPR